MDRREKVEATTVEETGVIAFQSKDGVGYAKLISEKMGFPLDGLKQMALVNMRKKDPSATVVSEERKRVNGTEVLAMKFDITSAGLPFRFSGYYFGGKSGSLQLATYTSSALFTQNEGMLTEFLNGL
jgi:hypothetical protein